MKKIVLTIVSFAVLLIVSGCYNAKYSIPKDIPNNAIYKTPQDLPNKAPKPAAAAPPPPPQSERMITEPSGGSAPPSSTTTNTQTTDTVTSQLYSASMAFSVPETANIAEDITVQLLLDPSKELKELEDNLTVPGNKTSKKVQISKIVVAKLTAPDFVVDNVTPDEQAVAQTAPTEWLWKLTPKSKGKHSVDLTITAVVKIDGKETKHHIKTYEKQIIIEVLPQQLLGDLFNKYWQWLFSTLVLPLGLWLYKRHKKE